MSATTVEEIRKDETSEDKKSELLLDSLEIKGYRCFEHLTIEKLGRVNLIVGKNNVGKTALLEALWIYANHDETKILHEIVFGRNEITDEKNLSHESLREYNFAIRNLFANRPATPTKNQIENESSYLVISEAGRDLDYLKHKFFNHNEEEESFNNKFDKAHLKTIGSKTTYIKYFYDFKFEKPVAAYLPRIDRIIKNLFINSAGLKNEKLIEFWDVIALTPLEDKVVEALHLLLPSLKRIDFIGYPNGSSNRVPVVRIKNEKERLPLKSFGEGMTRLLGISLALVQCQDGMLFIDEIESGLHYSVLPDVWKLIFKTAKDLNVQVFATTHSKDCVEVFAAAAEESPEDGMLIRLERQGEKIIAKTINEERLELAVNHDVEVR